MSGRIFLSASVPRPDRGTFHESADPFLIQFAVRELLTIALGRRRIVWGGHPAITPMVLAVCEDLGVQYEKAVSLYMSRFFMDQFPDEHHRFSNVTLVNAVNNDREQSLEKLRREMLSGDFEASVFIGGMEGIFAEHDLFTSMHPNSVVLPLYAPGGAARDLAIKYGHSDDRIDFARLLSSGLKIGERETRDQV
jgi:hypothetical protein